MSPKNLKQIHEECISSAKLSTSTNVQNGNLFRWKGSVTSFIVAELKFQCLPNFGLVLIDKSAFIPCIVVDPIASVSKLVNFIDSSVIIHNPEFTAEVVVTNSKEYSLIHVFIDIEKISTVEKSLKIIKTSKKIPSLKTNETAIDCIRQVFMIPLKVSSTILTAKSDLICLVLAFLLHPNSSDEKEELVWVVLKNHQVLWKDLLIPNRTYIIHLDQETPYDYFKNYSSLMTLIDKYLDLSFQQMLHHKELIKTNAVIFLPSGSRISSNFELRKNIVPEKWFGIQDKRLQSLKFASVFGIVQDIMYLEAWKSYRCSWCDHDAIRCSEEIPNSLPESNICNYEWSEKLTQQNIESENTEWIPNIEFTMPKNEKVIGFGIRGGKINVQVTLKDTQSEDIFYIFLKRWQQEQYPAGLMKGVALCFTDLNIKRSKKKNLYFVNTPLTRVVHLKTDNSENSPIHSWGKFGFPNIDANVGEKVWGILDLDFLCKVSISTKCKLCNESYVNYCCPYAFCPNNKRKMDTLHCETTASARLFVRGIEGFGATSLFLKNDDVRKYLGFPDRIWKKLYKLSALSELNYSYQAEAQNFENLNYLQIFFHLYCKNFRPKKRFHVCCKRFKGDGQRYFCLHLEEVTSLRLAISRVVLKCTSKETKE